LETAASLERLSRALKDGLEKPVFQEVLRSVIDEIGTQSDPDLIRLLAPHLDLVVGTRDFKTLRQKIRRERQRLDAVEAREDRAVGAAEEWAGLHLTRGRHALIVGGDRRDNPMKRIKAGLALDNVEWESGLQVRRLRQLSQRIRSGRVDMVMYLVQFVSHKAQDILRPACQTSGVPFLMVDRGYGVAAVRRAIEGQLLATS